MTSGRLSALFLLASSLLFPGCTPPLVLKAQSGDLEAARKVLAKPVDQETKNEALLEAVRAKHTDVAGLLLDRGADPNAKDELRIAALSLAIMRNDADTARLLLDHKADVNAVSGSFRYAKLEVATMLLDRGADPNAKDANGATALAYAACEGRADLVKLWLERGADAKSSGKACERSHFDVENVVNVCDDLATPLDCARTLRYDDIAAMLEAALKK